MDKNHYKEFMMNQIELVTIQCPAEQAAQSLSMAKNGA